MSEVMTVLARLDGDARSMVQAFDQAERAMKDTVQQSDRTSKETVSNFDRMGGGILKAVGPIAGAVAAAFSITAIVDFAGKALDAATDLNEAGTAVGAVFGPATAQIEQWAETAAGSLGQSELAALNAAKTFGVYGQQAGLAAGANAEFSMGLTQTASDLASFHNADPSEVIEAIGSGLRGEAEPLRRFGILMNEASLQAAALEAGIIQTEGPLTNQQKILAAQALIMQQTGAATGDFARTQDGLANQQRIAAANWANITAAIGQGFLPIATQVVSFFNSALVPALTSGAEAFGSTVGPALASIGERVGPLLQTLQPLGDAFLSLLGPVLELAMAFSPFGLVLQALTPVLPMVSALLIQVANTLQGALVGILPTVTSLVQTLAGALSGVLAAILPVIANLITMLLGAFQQMLPVLMPLAEAISGLLITALNALLPLLEPILALFMSLMGALMPLIEPILGIVIALMPLIDIVGVLIGALLPPLVELFVALLSPIMAVIEPLLGLLVPVLEMVATVLTVVIGWIADLITWLVDWATSTEGAGDAVGAVFEWLGGAIGNVVNGIGAVISWVGNLIGNVFAGVQAAVRVVGDVFGSVFRGIGSLVSDVFNGVVGVIRGAINGIIGIVNGAIGALNSVQVDIPDWVPLVGGQSFGINIPRIPYLENGGTVLAPGLTWVGERGPELLSLPRGATVAPIHKLDTSGGGEGKGGGNVYVDVHGDFSGMDEDELAERVGDSVAFAVGG